MSFLSLVLLGIGLAMDASCVSMAKGMTMEKSQRFRYALSLGLAFGFFQGFMPFLGWWAGSYFQDFITSIDHWIAFLLLGIIGFHMIKEALHPEENEEATVLNFKTILLLSIATSIDALAVGISFAFLKVDIMSAVSIIGITTFVLSFISVYIGNRLGDMLEKYAGILGGAILIFIGLKILIEHLFA